MSNLLEQAIIDATALREVALKNAEAALIEKYSKEFKESVEKLLEQEETIADPMATPELETPIQTDTGMALEKPEDEEAFSDVPSSFLEGDDKEMITIDFNQLKKQVSSVLGTANPVLATPEQPQTDEITGEEASAMMESFEIDEQELEEAYEMGNKDFAGDALNPGASSEIEEAFAEDKLISKKKKKKNGDTMPAALEEEEMEEQDMSPEEKAAEIKAAQEAKQAAEAAKKAAEARERRVSSSPTESPKRTPMAEDIEISEEELNELMEEMKVDIVVDNLSDGHMGTTVTQKREQRNMELAAARDEKQKEHREEELEAMADLKENLQEAIEVGAGLLEENEELKKKLEEMEQNLVSLKENVEKLSTSNAKLLYTNKVLGNSSLNERQKQQIVESISNSSSVLEAKTIYNTLQSAVLGVSNDKKPKESLSEALNRSNSPFLTRKQQTAELPFADRMKKLAGIS